MCTPRLLVSLLPVFALACGGSVSSDPSHSNQNQNQNNNQPQTHLPKGTIAGSFDLTFTKVTAVQESGSFAPTVSSPSQGGNARLDISSDSSATVTVTSRWGSPALFPAAKSSASLTLDTSTLDSERSANFGAQDSSSGIYVTDSWTKITLGRSSDGGFDGTFTATGNEEMFEGDEGFEATLTATGTIAADTTAPEIRADKVPNDGYLPWDPTHVRFAEPPTVAEESLLSLDVGGVITGDPTQLQATLLLKSWDATSANIAAKSFQDIAGNASQASSTPIKYLNVGTAKPAFTFDDTSAPIAPFAAPAGVITTLAADANCESGGCVKVTTTIDQECANPQMGFAGVLQQKSGHANTLHIRYRIFVGVNAESVNPTIEPETDAITVASAAPGLAAKTKTVGFAMTDLKTVPSTYGFTQATDWATADVPVDAGAQAGFAIKFTSSYCGGPIFDQDEKTVLIDSITID